GKGDVYGLPELMHNVANHEQTPLRSTLRAAGYTDIVRVPTRTFEEVIYPSIKDLWYEGKLPRKFLGETLDRRNLDAKPGGDRRKAPRHDRLIARDRRRQANKSGPDMMEFLVENRFINGTATMLIDLDRCTRCDDCVRACASGHDNNPRFVRHGKIHGHFMVANACMHCEDPVCMIGCPTGAIHRSPGGGEIVINDLTCIGCSTCANSCPYDNIRMVNVRDAGASEAVLVDPARGHAISKATKCDLCVDHHGGPACERACPHDALKRVDMDELESLSKWLNR
ncbi:MAG: 4Fe-4S dicluster domain-containing protein, partial [Pseudomonadales bacterium]|nr:4Fe-4S dicluster domain-containing protein [Pseudomonadales bacterium]